MADRSVAPDLPVASGGPVGEDEPDPMDEVEDFDPDDPGEPADESVAQARLLEAFPGAEEVAT